VVAGGWPPGSAAPGQPGAAAGSWRDRYGRGARDPVSGLYEWYEIPEDLARQRDGEAVSWEAILSHWTLIEADLQQQYGIDVEDRALMRGRTWRWLRLRIVGLLNTDSRLHRALAPDPEER
jgi:hypothetical protein